MKLSEEIISQIKSLKNPAIIAISGFGGSGKTTLANLLSETLDAPVISIDSFNKGLAEYSNWELMDFERYEKEIITPFYSGQNPLKYTHFSGETRENPKEVELKHNGIIIVEGVGIFRPELMKHYSYSIWVECPIDEAIRRGKKRDREVWHNPKDELWEGIWKKNDLEYYELFKPDKSASIIISNEKGPLEIAH
jgi:uridine kinase